MFILFDSIIRYVDHKPIFNCSKCECILVENVSWQYFWMIFPVFYIGCVSALLIGQNQQNRYVIMFMTSSTLPAATFNRMLGPQHIWSKIHLLSLYKVYWNFKAVHGDGLFYTNWMVQAHNTISSSHCPRLLELQWVIVWPETHNWEGHWVFLKKNCMQAVNSAETLLVHRTLVHSFIGLDPQSSSVPRKWIWSL